jgi:diguanylate cyclase (GGDEF)-like protein
MPRLVLTAVAEALQNPQPLGWGLDPALDPVVEAFAEHVATPDQTIAQLACLRLALHDVVVREAPPEERDETLERVSTVVDHTMMVAARVRTSKLHDEALADGLTGLGNRRAFDRDLDREIARARRNGSPLTLAVVDLDGLKRINDIDGHAAGDAAIVALADALRATSRRGDRAYRIGGDEFAVLLSDALIVEPELFAARLREAGAPACTVGTAASPPDPLDDLFSLADRALYRIRAEARSASRERRREDDGP